jgi:hypothetical protein
VENSKGWNYWIDVTLIVLLVTLISIAFSEAGKQNKMHCIAGAAFVKTSILLMTSQRLAISPTGGDRVFCVAPPQGDQGAGVPSGRMTPSREPISRSRW